MTIQDKNMTMLCDFYELTMGNGYLRCGYKDRITYFDVFFRTIPDKGGFAIAAGLEQVIDYIENLHFSKEDIAYLRGRKLFDEEFLTYLESFQFTGDIYAVPEGTPIFPQEPILTVRAPAIQAQLIETFLLLALNHQSLIATKANRIVRAAEGRTVLEFGSRRAQGAELLILVVARELPARSRISFTEFGPAVPWPMLGYKCLKANLRLLRHTVKSIPIMLCCS